MTKQCIIFLKGVDPKCYIDIADEFEASLLETIERPPLDIPIEEKYNKIPNMFTSIDTWIKKTNLKCWHCDFTFKNSPIFIPTFISLNQWGTKGNFCSFSCAMAYINTYHKENSIYKKNLRELYYKINRVRVYNISEAPPRHLMEKYGGYMKDVSYLDILYKLERNIGNGTVDINRTYMNPIKPEAYEELEPEDAGGDNGTDCWSLSHYPE